MRSSTVDNSENSPEQEDNEESDCFFTLWSGDALDEDKIKAERRQHDHCVKQLQQHKAQTTMS